MNLGNSIYNDCYLDYPSYGTEPFFLDDFLTDKDANAFKKSVERLVRTSPEYKRWIEFVHGVLGIQYKCYQTGETNNACSIELHHHPFTLYDIVSIVLENTEVISSFSVASEVMALHYKNLVGFVPLCSTSHEKYHNRAICIPMEVVEGRWDVFITKYDLSEDHQDRLAVLSQYTLDSVEEDWVVQSKQYILKTS